MVLRAHTVVQLIRTVAVQLHLVVMRRVLIQVNARASVHHRIHEALLRMALLTEVLPMAKAVLEVEDEVGEDVAVEADMAAVAVAEEAALAAEETEAHMLEHEIP